MKLITIILLPCLLFSPSISFAEQEEQCPKLGESSSVGGVPDGEWKLDHPCCPGLIDRETVLVCNSGYGGGYTYICLKCGDASCDPRFENKCNCPEDCSVQELSK